MKYFQVTVYLEEILGTTDHTGKNKLKKEYKHFLVEMTNDTTDGDGSSNGTNFDEVVTKFTDSNVIVGAGKKWSEMVVFPLPNELPTDYEPKSHIGEFNTRKITQVKLLPIEDLVK